MGTYVQEVLADTPVVYYRMGESSGTVAFDSSGNGRDGTYQNTPTLDFTPGAITGDDDGAVRLTRSQSEYVSFPTTGLPSGASAYTLEVWFRATVVDDRQGLVSLGVFGSTRQANAVRLSGSNGAPSLTHYWWGADMNAVSVPIVLNTWHHMVATWDGSWRRLYFDGAQVAADQPGNPAVVLGTPTFGRTATNLSEYFDGAIDEGAIYNYALSAARVLAHYNARTVPPFGAFGSGASDAQVTPAVVIAAIPSSINGSGSSDSATGAARLINRADTSNREGGRWRRATGTAEWYPTVAPVPTGVLMESRDVAVAFDGVPTVSEVDARITYSVSKIEEISHRTRVIIGSKDVSFWRGVPTPIPNYALIEPLGYGPATVVLPQVAAAFETPGEGALSFMRPGARVLVQRVDVETGAVVATDYKGVVLAYDASGMDLVLTVGGEASGRASLLDKQPPIFFWRKDLGRYAHDAIRGLRLPFEPYLGPETDIKVMKFGGLGYLDFLQQLTAMGTTRSGNQWTIMPNWTTGKYEMFRKDKTTIRGTVYLDDQRTIGSLRRDIGEEPNRVYMTGVNEEGMRVRFGRYPGLKQMNPPPYAGPYSSGDTGDAVTLIINRLHITKYLTRREIPGGFDSEVVKAVKDLQKDAGIKPRDGIVNKKTWNALWDLSTTGFSLRGSHIGPAAEDPKVKPWNRSASGGKISRNPDYDRSVLPVDRTVDAGTGFERGQLKEWAEAEIEEAQASPNWIGSITFTTNALVAGEHNPGEPFTLLRARDLRPGDNLWLPLFGGGIVVHISAINVSAETGEVSVDVDTRARDAMEVWEVLARNKEARRSLRREWLREYRSSTQTKDSGATWDEVGGRLYEKIEMEAGTWTVFPVIAGQEGEVQWLHTETNPNAEYVMAVFGKKIGPRKLRKLIGNPLTRTGTRKWEKEDVRRILKDEHVILYVAGSNIQPLGYWPKAKTKRADDDVSPAPLTGKWEDDASFPYRCFPSTVLWVAVWVDRNSAIPRGRIMRPQLGSEG